MKTRLTTCMWDDKQKVIKIRSEDDEISYATWISWINYKNRYVELLVLHLMSLVALSQNLASLSLLLVLHW